MSAANAALENQGARRLSLPGGEIAAATIVWLSLGLLLFGIALRLLVFGLDLPVWRDEASLSFNFLEWDYRRLLGELNNRQIAPLWFLWIEKTVCLLAGPSAYWLRLVPLLAGVGGLVLFWRLAQTVLSPIAVAFAVGLLAVSWPPIELASTIKPYAIDLFVSVLLLHLAVLYLRRSELRQSDLRQSALRGSDVRGSDVRQTDLRQAEGKKFLILLTLVAPLAVGVSYPSVFVAGAVSLVLAPVVRRKGWGDRGWFLAFNALLLTAFLAHLLLVGRPIDPARPSELNAYMKQYWSHGFPHGGPGAWLWWTIRVHFASLFSYPADFMGSSLIGLGLLVLGVRALVRQGQRPVVFLCLLPFALHLLAALLQRYPYGAHPRLEQDLLPGFCLLAGAGLASLIQQLAKTPAGQARWLVATTAGLVVVGLYVAVSFWRQPYHDVEAQWARDVVQGIRQEIRPDDVIFVRRSSTSICLRWQMLAVSHQVQNGPARQPALSRPTSRFWIIDQNCADVPVGLPEPAPVPPNKSSDPLISTPDLRSVRHHRYRATIPGEGANVYRYLCDVYVFDPADHRRPGDRESVARH
jgi:hypothetical protein